MIALSISSFYTIHAYREDLFKVVGFKGLRDPDSVKDRADWKSNDTKLTNNYSRARSMVLQYALCNPWEYFFTGTLDQRKYNRYNLDRFMGSLSQFIRDQRKKWNSQIQVLLIPEHHNDGAWHVHGMINGLPDQALRKFRYPEPRKLIEGGYLNWSDFQRKFGFCSLGRISNPVGTAFYITKYISKDLSQRNRDLGKHLYFHSRPLRTAEAVSEIYGWNAQLDSFCVTEHEFCSTGFAFRQPWYFPYVWDGSYYKLPELVSPDDYDPLEAELQQFDPSEIDPFYEQVKLSDF